MTTRSSEAKPGVWVSMVDLVPVHDRAVPSGMGAIVWVAARAVNRDQLLLQVASAIEADGFVLVGDEETREIDPGALPTFGFDMADVVQMLYEEPLGTVFFDEFQYYPLIEEAQEK